MWLSLWIGVAKLAWTDCVVAVAWILCVIQVKSILFQKLAWFLWFPECCGFKEWGCGQTGEEQSSCGMVHTVLTMWTGPRRTVFMWDGPHCLHDVDRPQKNSLHVGRSTLSSRCGQTPEEQSSCAMFHTVFTMWTDPRRSLHVGRSTLSSQCGQTPEEQSSCAMFHTVFTTHRSSNLIVLLLHQIMLKSIQP